MERRTKIMNIPKEIEEAIKDNSISKHYRHIIMMVDDMSLNMSRIEFDAKRPQRSRAAIIRLRKQLSLLANYSMETRVIALALGRHRENILRLERKEREKEYDKILRDEKL
jgi:hypothetical protein